MSGEGDTVFGSVETDIFIVIFLKKERTVVFVEVNWLGVLVGLFGLYFVDESDVE